MFNSHRAASLAIFKLGVGEGLQFGLELFDVNLGALNSFLDSSDATPEVVKEIPIAE